MAFGRGQLTRPVRIGQLRQYMIAARVDGTGTAALLSSSKDLTLVDNGTGDYTLTFVQAYAQVPVVMAMPLTADVNMHVAAVSASSVQINAFDATDGTTAKDTDFHIMILGSYAEDEV